MTRVLIVDDDESIRYSLSRIVRKKGLEPITVGTCREALDRTKAADIDLVFLDVRLPDGNGLEIIPELARSALRPQVIIITGYGDADGAELAITSGAWDYIEKTDSIQKINLTLDCALLYRTKSDPSKETDILIREQIVGRSARLEHCLSLLAKSASTDANVLITGETGTGKELFARAIHQNSDRANSPFVVVDCTALPHTLAESLLFGHRRGAFTGADQDREGLIAQADGGTLFLDEIGELDLPLQKAFLRILQERRLRPLGSGREVNVNFRLIAATNRNLNHMSGSGNFRQDLLYRIKAFHIHLPPLRERSEDINPIVTHYIKRFCQDLNLSLKDGHPDFLETLSAYDWPGNVRELVHAIHYAISVARQMPILFANHLPPSIRTKTIQAKLTRTAFASDALPDGEEIAPSYHLDRMPPLKSVREEQLSKVERRYLMDLMQACNGCIRTACRISDLSQSRLYALLKHYNIPTTTP